MSLSRISKPNKKVLKAFIESYFNIRKKTWGLTDEQLLLAVGNTPAAKRDVCKKLLNEINNAESVDDWIGIIYSGFNKEKIEESHQRGIVLNVLAFLVRPFMDTEEKEYLRKTLMAVVSLIISELPSSDFQARIKKIENDKIDLEKLKDNVNTLKTPGKIDEIVKKIKEIEECLKALNHCNNYHPLFFKDVILASDPKVGESTYEDFVKNVNDNNRQPIFCNKLTPAIANQAPAKAETTEQKVEQVEMGSTEIVVPSPKVVKHPIIVKDNTSIDNNKIDPPTEASKDKPIPSYTSSRYAFHNKKKGKHHEEKDTKDSEIYNLRSRKLH